MSFWISFGTFPYGSHETRTKGFLNRWNIPQPITYHYDALFNSLFRSKNLISKYFLAKIIHFASTFKDISGRKSETWKMAINNDQISLIFLLYGYALNTFEQLLSLWENQEISSTSARNSFRKSILNRAQVIAVGQENWRNWIIIFRSFLILKEPSLEDPS